MSQTFKQALIAIATTLIAASTAWSCTGIQLKATDNTFATGRTVEFGINLNLAGLIIPRNYEFKGTLPDGSAGLTYRSKYAVIGGSMFGEMAIADGVNEKGLSVGDFYFPGYAGYAPATLANKSRALSPTEFSNWILTQFATVDEVKNGLKNAVIVPTIPKGWPVLPPFHYVVYDRQGKSIVIEPVEGKLYVYDNPIGVFTNSPTFDWHLTNLSNYVNLSPINAAPRDVNGLILQQFGQGSGLHGLPGDFTSPSRFVRAAVFATTAMSPENSPAAILQVFHMLNQFDIPLGAVRDQTSNGVVPESTIATIARDPQTLRFYFKTYADQTIKMVDLKAFDWNAKQIKTFDINTTQVIQDLSSTAK